MLVPESQASFMLTLVLFLSRVACFGKGRPFAGRALVCPCALAWQVHPLFIEDILNDAERSKVENLGANGLVILFQAVKLVEEELGDSDLEGLNVMKLEMDQVSLVLQVSVGILLKSAFPFLAVGLVPPFSDPIPVVVRMICQCVTESQKYPAPNSTQTYHGHCLLSLVGIPPYVIPTPPMSYRPPLCHTDPLPSDLCGNLSDMDWLVCFQSAQQMSLISIGGGQDNFGLSGTQGPVWLLIGFSQYISHAVGCRAGPDLFRTPRPTSMGTGTGLFTGCGPEATGIMQPHPCVVWPR